MPLRLSLVSVRCWFGLFWSGSLWLCGVFCWCFVPPFFGVMFVHILVCLLGVWFCCSCLCFVCVCLLRLFFIVCVCMCYIYIILYFIILYVFIIFEFSGVSTIRQLLSLCRDLSNFQKNGCTRGIALPLRLVCCVFYVFVCVICIYNI